MNRKHPDEELLLKIKGLKRETKEKSRQLAVKDKEIPDETMKVEIL